VTSATPRHELLAHSAKGNVPAQKYRTHVGNVRRQAVKNAEEAARFYSGDRDTLIATVAQAAIYHDLGKLDEANQQVLRRKSRKRLPLAHEDAGAALLLRGCREAAVLVAAHHAGLFSQSEEMGKRARILRNLGVAAHVDERMEQYEAAHQALHLEGPLPVPACSPVHHCGLTRRLSLSCLVDADHGDTAKNYGNEVISQPPSHRWAERLAALDGYVALLPKGDTDAKRCRNALREEAYRACREAAITPSIRACDAPVGTGKTTAVMAHLLRVAIARELRHILVVLPYTNIIKQSVDVYRKALVLPGERPEEVVAEHHHQADFEELSLRQFAALWRAPIIVTTAVQFFETLAACHPARLRKLHELPGSAVFVDEAHAAIPSHLWPQVWRWLETWTHEWGGHLVLASGSLARFWELKEFVDPPRQPQDIPDLVPTSLRADLHLAESLRLPVCRRRDPLSCDKLIEWVSSQPGPRLVILNTVQSAAVVADRMRRVGKDVVHLSTALAPVHRERIVERVKERLKCGIWDWTLVATSCVEAGMDFSFRTGFRESCSTASLIQVGGRVSRQAEHEDAVVWDFRTRDVLLTAHRGFEVPRRVLNGLFDMGLLGNKEKSSASELAKEAMRREITDAAESRAMGIIKAEAGMEYPAVARLCRVIDADTRVVVVDPRLIELLRNRERVSPTALVRSSVQIWATNIRQWDIAPLFPGDLDEASLYVWTGPYDPDFLGYMAGVLPLVYAGQDGLRPV